jgi:hypothetical protein
MKKAVLVVLVVNLFFLSCENTAQKETPATDFEYTENEKAITITNYIGESKDVVIPRKINKINKLPVTAIGSMAFYEKELTSVVLPVDLIEIGEGAFYNNQLTSIAIPKKVLTIAYGAFYGNSIDNVVIHNGVKTIEENAFNEGVLDKETKPIVQNNNKSKLNDVSNFEMADVRKDASKYAQITTSIKLYERDTENANWFDRQKLTTTMAINDRKKNNGTTAFNVAIDGNVRYTKDNNSFIVPQTRDRYGFFNEYWFSNIFYYEPLDRVVSVEYNIKYMWVTEVYFNSGAHYTDTNAIAVYANSIYVNKKTNVDDPTGKYRHIQLKNVSDSVSSALNIMEALYKVSTNPDSGNGVIEAFINN